MSIYDNLYNIIQTYIYGGNMTADSELICTLVSTIGCLFLVSLPFVVVLKVIRIILG